MVAAARPVYKQLLTFGVLETISPKLEILPDTKGNISN